MYQRSPILSRPIKLHWAGWETDTFRLQQCGWQLSADQDLAYNKMRIALRHADLGMRAISQSINFNYHEALLDPRYIGQAVIGIQAMAPDIHIHRRPIMREYGDVSNFRAIDAAPQFNERLDIQSLDDFAHFAAPLVRTQEIIVPEESVDDLLARILDKQQSAKRAYFEDKVRRMRSDGDVPQQAKFHAQIISLSERRAA